MMSKKFTRLLHTIGLFPLKKGQALFSFYNEKKISMIP